MTELFILVVILGSLVGLFTLLGTLTYMFDKLLKRIGENE